jgi:hypothetical protein
VIRRSSPARASWTCAASVAADRAYLADVRGVRVGLQANLDEVAQSGGGADRPSVAEHHSGCVGPVAQQPLAAVWVVDVSRELQGLEEDDARD